MDGLTKKQNRERYSTECNRAIRFAFSEVIPLILQKEGSQLLLIIGWNCLGSVVIMVQYLQDYQMISLHIIRACLLSENTMAAIWCQQLSTERKESPYADTHHPVRVWAQVKRLTMVKLFGEIHLQSDIISLSRFKCFWPSSHAGVPLSHVFLFLRKCQDMFATHSTVKVLQVNYRLAVSSSVPEKMRLYPILCYFHSPPHI